MNMCLCACVRIHVVCALLVASAYRHMYMHTSTLQGADPNRFDHPMNDEVIPTRLFNIKETTQSQNSSVNQFRAMPNSGVVKQ